MAYFKGSDASQWQNDVPLYRRLEAQGIYPGIDVHYYSQGQKLEFDFIVAPGMDPSQIIVHIEGADSIRMENEGIRIDAGNGHTLFQPPITYQTLKGKQVPVASAFALDESSVHFVVDAYDESLPLTIDPVIVASTYLGGAGGHDPVTGISITNNAIFACGITSSDEFPFEDAVVQPGGKEKAARDSKDVFVVRFNGSLTTLEYATIIGGDRDDEAYDIVADDTGMAFVCGATESYQDTDEAGFSRCECLSGYLCQC